MFSLISLPGDWFAQLSSTTEDIFTALSPLTITIVGALLITTVIGMLIAAFHK